MSQKANTIPLLASIPWKFLITQYLLLRILTLVAAWWGMQLLPFKPTFSYWDLLPRFGPSLLASWANFDGIHYLLLSQQGYAFDLTQAFFPIYFLLIKMLTVITTNPLVSGLLVSNICFFAAITVLYKLVRLDYSESVARRTVIFLTFFPTSFYFLSVYTESLFLLLLLLIFYFIRTQELFKASVSGIVLAASRIVGVFIVPSYLYEVWVNNNQKTLPKLKTIILAVIPVLGLLGYMTYLGWKFDDPLAFVHVQSKFGAGRETDKFILLYQVLWRYLKMILTVDKSNPIYFTVWLELLSTLLFIALLIWGLIKKVRLSYLMFAALALILPTLTGNLSSMPRYVLVLFPGFMVMAMIQKSWVQTGILLVSSILLVLCTALFIRGYWIA